MGILKAVLDAIVGEDNKIAGQRFTRLTGPLSEDAFISVGVESTLGFGYSNEAEGYSSILVGNEQILCVSRTDNSFDLLVRSDGAKAHPTGTLVYDYSRNQSALDHVRRGFLVDYAVQEDLNIIGRNLGLHKCRGIPDDETWRAVIRVMAYLPKTTPDAFRKVLDVVLGKDNYEIYPSVQDPYTIDLWVSESLGDDLEGRFLLNGGEPQLTTGSNTVSTTYAINNVLGVYDDTVLTRYGIRDGFTNYYAGPGGSFTGDTITLNSSPGLAGQPVLVDYGAFPAHYLALNELDLAQENHPFLGGELAGYVLCLLDQIKGANIRVRVKN